MFELAWSLDTVSALIQVIIIDLILSGDNAIIIAMATRKLPEDKRNKAIYWGTFFAIALRILFATVIVFLLQLSWISFIGGLLLLYIAYKVLVEKEEEKEVDAKNSMMGAIYTIIMADAVMSLDNVMAVAGAADGHILILAIGVLISIPIMIFGSKLILHYMKRFPWISYVGSGIIAWIGGGMMFEDPAFMKLIAIQEGSPVILISSIIATILVLSLAYIKNKRIATKAVSANYIAVNSSDFRNKDY